MLLESGANMPDEQAIIQRHHAAQRMLQPRKIVIPLAERIAARFDIGRVEARRAFTHLMSMIEASALLHQYQRQLDGEGRLMASPDDYELARNLCGGPLARLLGGRISDAAIRFYDRLAAWGPAMFTTTEAFLRDAKAPQTVRDWLRELSEAGAVEQVVPPRGNCPATWRLTGLDRDELVAKKCRLPTLDEL